jgi:hypothetical protein
MRTVNTFIVRLLVDPDDLNAVRGTLQAAAESESYSFTSGKELLNLFRRLLPHVSMNTEAVQPEDSLTKTDAQ